MDEHLIRKILASIKCGVCGHYYQPSKVDVLGHHDDMWFFKTRCASCHTQCLVAAIISQDQKPEIITDLSMAEVEKFGGQEIPTGNDLLDMHNFLATFDGDFAQLFSPTQQ